MDAYPAFLTNVITDVWTRKVNIMLGRTRRLEDRIRQHFLVFILELEKKNQYSRLPSSSLESLAMIVLNFR